MTKEEKNKTDYLPFVVLAAASTLAIFYLCDKLEEAKQKEDELKEVIKEKTETNKQLNKELVTIASREVNITNNNTFSPSNNLQQTIMVNPDITQKATKEKKNTSRK